MAVTKTLTKAVPHVKSSKVERWDLEMRYENDSEGDATHYVSTFSTTVESVDPLSGATVFSKKAKGSWTKSELEGICPTAKWDAIFASQVDSVITNPPSNPVPDTSYTIPS
jgi:hypothetical protein